MARQHFGERINRWLAEAPGEVFTRGKWRFWLPVVIAFTILNTILTALIFSDGAAQSANHTAALIAGVGAVLCWLSLGFLHYSDNHDRRLARGVSALDSITLVFVTAHFCGLLWAYGRFHTLRGADIEYKAATAAYNAQAREMQADNAKIADALRDAASAERERARIEADTAYQLRKAAERGARVRQSASAGGINATITMAAPELAKPQAPPESSTDFLTRWDAWIRLTNFGELILAVATLIFIRNRTAKTNAGPAVDYGEPYFAPGAVSRIAAVTPAFEAPPREKFTAKKETTKNHGSFDFARAAGAQALRDALKDISFRLKGYSFKVTVKPDCVWIMMVEANQGTQQTVASAKAKLSILDDAVRMERNAFRERLEKFLRERGFGI